MNQKYQVDVKLGAKRSYPVIIESGILNNLGSILKAMPLGKRIAIVSTPQVADLYLKKLQQTLTASNFQTLQIIVPEGESHKKLATVADVLDQLVANKFERKDTVIALGGGVIGDMAGFAAAIYLRGINIIHCPTTLLSQSDSAIGGKTGVNHPTGKNLIGAFYQPKATIVDTSTLATLPQKEIACGLAEIVKYGIIRNKALFWFIERNVKQIYTGSDYLINENIWQYLVWRSCVNKAYVVSKDEKESGLREILNFGHTIGHAIEAVFNYKLYTHGESVVFGMIAATRIAEQLEMIDHKTSNRILSLFKKLGFADKIQPVDPQLIITRLSADKKVKDGKIRFVLPTAIGQVVVRDDVSMAVIEKVVKELQD